MHLCAKETSSETSFHMGKRASVATVFTPSPPSPPSRAIRKRAPSRLNWPARLPGVLYDDRLEVAVLLVVYSLCGREF